jgi:hypothetical protein
MWETRSDKRFRPACFSTWAIRAGIIPNNGSRQREASVQIDFRSSERSSLGVEMELEIIDLESRELRSGDGLPTTGEVATVAAMSQCLVDRLNTLMDRGYTLPVPRSWIIRENKWRAARYGLDAEIIALAIMERGPSYIRQREVIAAGGAMTDVVDSLVTELRTDRLTPTPKPAIP